MAGARLLGLVRWRSTPERREAWSAPAFSFFAEEVRVIGDGIGVLASLVILIVAGDQFVIGVARVASVMRVRPSVVGALIGGLGASLPELIVAGVAAQRGTTQLAIGSLVGSNVANICLALGIAALVAPVRVDSRTIRREIPISVAGVVVFAVFLIGGISRPEGILMAIALVAAVILLFANASGSTRGDELELEVGRFVGKENERPSLKEGTRVGVSLVAMVIGAEILVQSASGLAAHFDVAEGFVGLTLVGIGTSAPLIAIAIQAARRGNHDLVVGNVFGSNLFIALAGGALVAFLGSGSQAVFELVPVVLMAGVCIAAWFFMARGSLLNRWEAGILILVYAAGLAASFR
jgi:cation:H+ antiporter